MFTFWVQRQFLNVEFSTLDELQNGTDTWKTKLCIKRLWRSLNLKKKNKLMSIDMVLTDEKVLILLLGFDVLVLIVCLRTLIVWD